MKKCLRYTLCMLATLLLLYALLFSALQLVLGDEDWFRTEYEAFAEDDLLVLDMSISDSTAALLRLIAYMEGQVESIQLTVTIAGEATEMYNAKEIAHMVDVRVLYQGFRSARNIALCVCVLLFALAYFWDKRDGGLVLSRGYLWGCAAFAALLLAVALFVLVDFNAFWTQFHYLFFSNDLWLLNPATDNMILICPEALFYDIVLRFGLLALLAIGLLSVAASLYIHRRRKRV